MNNSRTMRAMRKMSRPSLEKMNKFLEAAVEAKRTGDCSGMVKAVASMTAAEEKEMYHVLEVAFGKRVVRLLSGEENELVNGDDQQ